MKAAGSTFSARRSARTSSEWMSLFLLASKKSSQGFLKGIYKSQTKYCIL